MVKFPRSRTFDHLDKAADRIVHFLAKLSNFRQFLEGVLAPASYCIVLIENP